MGIIRKLSKEVAGRIAAGEVIERPASALKELIENAIDAHSSRIVVELEAGGKKRIAVSDDGSGMSKEDLQLSIERHATSKIQSALDLEQIKTMGFRGEALPSIASVSLLKILSRQAEEEVGAALEVNGGKKEKITPAGCAKGTMVEIKNLFYNLPARKKFLRGDASEYQHALTTFVNAALAHPAIAFVLFKDDKQIYSLPAAKGDYQKRHFHLFGQELAKDLEKLEVSNGPFKLSAFLGTAQQTKGNSKGMRTFLNGRPINSRNINHAILNAYRSVIARDRYPVATIYLQADPAIFDVNVHPAKNEVKFQDERKLHHFIYQALSEKLSKQNFSSSSWPTSTFHKESGTTTGNQIFSGAISQLDSERQYKLNELYSRLAAEDSESKGKFSSLRLIGQFQKTFLLLENEQQLFIIDQHAAHERVNFEKLRDAFKQQQKINSQLLLFPLNLELEVQQMEAIRQHKEIIEKLGFVSEEFGQQTILIREVPELLLEGQTVQALRDILDELLESGKNYAFDKYLENHLQTIACHSSVRAKEHLESTEIRQLLKDLDRIDFAASCPHGRPVYACLNSKEVGKLFDRH